MRYQLLHPMLAVKGKSMKYFQERGTIYIINVYLKALIPRNQLKDRVYAREVHYLEMFHNLDVMQS